MKAIKNIKLFIPILMLIGGYILSSHLHLFLKTEDKKITKIITEDLNEKGYVYFSKIISTENAKRVCILPHYSTISSIENEFNSEQKRYLNLRINRRVGTNDRIWWILSPISENTQVSTYKISSVMKPNFTKPKCINLKSSSKMFVTKKDGYIFFDIQ